MTITISDNSSPLVRKLKAIGDSRRDKTVIVGTHDGSWHPDELLAIAVLMEALPNYTVKVIRSRDDKVLGQADILVDVGGGEFDHHSTAEIYPNGVVKAACGKVLDAVETDRQLKSYLLWDLFYAVEAEDNGQPARCLPPCLPPSKLHFVRMFNTVWTERMRGIDQMGKFNQVLNMVHEIYVRARVQAKSRIEAKGMLSQCKTYLNGKFIILPDGGIQWQQYAYQHPNLLGAIYKGDDGLTWVLRVAKENPAEATNRVTFPYEWGGLSGTELERVSGITGAIFCHKNLFVMKFNSCEAAFHAARILSSYV